MYKYTFIVLLSVCISFYTSSAIDATVSTEAKEPADRGMQSSTGVEIEDEEPTPDSHFNFATERPMSIQELEAERHFNDAMAIINKTRSGEVPNAEAFKHLLAAAELNHQEAREKIATAFLVSDASWASLNSSFADFKLLASEGSPRGQWGLAFFHLTGMVPQSRKVSTPHGLIYLNFAALSGDHLAQMTMGYRKLAGVGFEESCEDALVYYSQVAGHVAELINERTKKGGVSSAGTSVHRIRLSDEAESGIMGASSSGGSLFIDENLLEYFQLLADKKNSTAQVGLGQLYYHGKHGVSPDHDKALYYFKMALNTKADPAEGPITATAMAYMGEIYMAGTETLAPDATLALTYFRKAAEINNPMALTGLGLSYIHGRGGLTVDPLKALQYFLRAAEQGSSEAQLNLGIMFLGMMGSQTDYKLALKYLTLASQQGNVLAIYHLGRMHTLGLGVLRSCSTATELLKNVAERGRWALMFNSAHAAYWAKRYNEAFMQYLFLGELGYEVAQSNVAFLLEEKKVTLVPSDEVYARALVMLQRSANQGSVTSRLRVGDYHYYGMGTSQDYSAAIRHYRLAADGLHSAQAMFNLAYMHEAGLGYKKDLHLAKRYYDLAAQSSTDAYVPTTLALFKLSFSFLLEGWNDPKYWEQLYRWLRGSDQAEVKPMILNADTMAHSESRSRESQWRQMMMVKLENIDWDYFMIPLLFGLMLALYMYMRVIAQQQVRTNESSAPPNSRVEQPPTHTAQNASGIVVENSSNASTEQANNRDS